MTALFVVTTIIGLSAVASTLVASTLVASTLVAFTVLPRSDRDAPPFRLVGQAVGLLAAGLGGTVTGTVPVGDFGEVLFKDRVGEGDLGRSLRALRVARYPVDNQRILSSDDWT